MPPDTLRRFTLVDAMVLIAATGLSLVLIRDYLASQYTHYIFTSIIGRGLWSVASVWRLGSLASGMIAPLAVALSLALWLLRLREPRPSLHRVFRQPGMVACSAALFETGLFVIKACIATLYFYKVRSMMPDSHRLWMIRLPWNGEVVAVAWLLLSLSGTWQAEPSWI